MREVDDGEFLVVIKRIRYAVLNGLVREVERVQEKQRAGEFLPGRTDPSRVLRSLQSVLSERALATS